MQALYDRLFTWIVGKVNNAIDPSITEAYVPNSTVIGVLDIYGFEIFQNNSFEQVKAVIDAQGLTTIYLNQLIRTYSLF